MNNGPFISYAQNREDVVLWRALGHIHDGRYIDVGAWDADVDSVTRAFYDRGWRGLNVEPVPRQATAIRARRPEDETVEAAVSTHGEDLAFFEVLHPESGQTTGLSTLDGDVAAAHAADGWVVNELRVAGQTLQSLWSESALVTDEVHFLKVDVEGAEGDVLASLDLSTHRPWVIVVEATAPMSTEPTYGAWEPHLLASNYRFCLFDGLSRFYVAAEHADLAPALSYPACVFDTYTSSAEMTLRQDLQRSQEAAQEAHRFAAETHAAAEAARTELAEATAVRERLWQDLLDWRSAALDHWAAGLVVHPAAPNSADIAHLQEEIHALRGSLSWRITEPLRRAASNPQLLSAARKALHQ